MNRHRAGVAVIGVGTTAFGRLPGRSRTDLAGWALAEALADAGIERADIDGLITSGIAHADKFAEATGLRPDLALAVPAAGRTTGPAIDLACALIEAGRARRIALVYGSDARSAKLSFGGIDDGFGAGATAIPYGMTSPGALHAAMFSRYMYQTGASPGDLAEIAVAFRQHASLNPAAVMREPIDRAAHEASPLVVAPLRRLDYCIVNDGGVALLLGRADEVQPGQRPVFVRGTGQASDFTQASFLPTDYWFAPCQRAHRTAFARAEVARQDISALMIYDNFTPTVLFALEGFGYARQGEAWREIQEGSLRLGSSCPVNSSGGHLSESYMQGWALNVEAVRQLRGDCGARQVAGAVLVDVVTAAPQCSSIIYGIER